MFTIDKKRPTTIYIKCARNSLKPINYKYDGYRELASSFFAERFNSSYHYTVETISYNLNEYELDSNYDVFKATAYPVKKEGEELDEIIKNYPMYDRDLNHTIDLYEKISKRLGINLAVLLRKTNAFAVYNIFRLHSPLKKSINLLAVDADTIEYIPYKHHTKPAMCLGTKIDAIKALYGDLISSQLNEVGFDESHYFDFFAPLSENNVELRITTNMMFKNELTKRLNEQMDTLFAAMFDGKFVETLNNLHIDIEELKKQLIGSFTTTVDLKLNMNTKEIL
jgi:hypothetical protein